MEISLEFLVYSLLWMSTQATENESVITCTDTEQCILPCHFQPDGKGARIMWYVKGAIVSCTRYGDTSFVMGFNSQCDRYKGRTHLFAEEVLEGNANLILKNVTPHDQDRYFCVTMTAPRTDQSGVITLRIKAPVRRVDIGFSDNSVTCSTEGVYPSPSLVWSMTPPPETGLLQAQTTTKENQMGFYDIQSFLPLQGTNPTNNTYICQVATDTSQRTAFLHQHAPIFACPRTNVTVPCSLPHNAQSYNLSWRFGLSDSILSITVTKQKPLVKVWDRWKPLVSVSVPSPSVLTLVQVKRGQQGTYTCEVNTPEETYTTLTDVTVQQEVYVQVSSGLCCSLVVLGIVLILTIKRDFFSHFLRRSNQVQVQEAADDRPEELKEL